jgi:tetratricopeptide (TPR) repeat protein
MTEIPASCLAEAARALMLAGRWLEATELLRAAAATDEGERSVLAEAAAEVAIEQDFWIRTDIGSRALDHAFAVKGSSHELEFLQLKHDYNAVLFAGFGGGERDPLAIAELKETASWLRDAAPTVSQRAWAAFYAGLIADVLGDDESAGRAAYSQALADGTEAGDDLVVSYALRHLGDLDARAGSVDAAREQLAQSLEVRQRLGCVPHALAQQLALAELAHDSGDVSWAQTVAGQVHAWALALPGDPWLVPASAELL